MKRPLVLTSLFLAFAFTLMYIAPYAFAQQTKKPKEIIISTADINEDYEILGIVSVRFGEVDLSSINERLKEEAKKLDADGVVAVRYFDYSGYLYAYGTAVKIKKTETGKSQKHAF